MNYIIIFLILYISSVHAHSLFKWTKFTPTGTIPTNITNAVVEFSDYSIYSIGGHRELWLPSGVNITFFDNVYKLDLDTYVWSEVNITGNKPSARAYAAYIRSNYDGKIYMYGGTTFLNDYTITAIFSDLWSFEPSTQSFTKIVTTNIGPGNRTTSEMFQIGSKLYLTCGISGADEFGIPVYANDLWYLDLSLPIKTWYLVNTIISPPPRGSFFKFQKYAKLYICGGEVLDLETFEFLTLDDTWVFDTSSMTWTDITPDSEDNIFPFRSYTSSFPFGLTNWLVYGGEIPGPVTGCFSPFPANVADDTWVYNIISDKWHQIHPIGDIPPPLKRHAGVRTGLYKGYYIAGWSFYCTPTDQRGQIFNNDVYSLAISSF